MHVPPHIPTMPTPPQDRDGPVFHAPWEAQAFALTLDLYAKGHFTWPEWVSFLSNEIAAKPPGEVDRGDTYYLYWLAALEKMVTAKGLTSREDLAKRKAEWQAADRERGFGEPPVLKRSR